ncbi:MAG: hypothetical protein H6559_32520 [Lewinellaceae bacterium]|nr:hypothetical protein [Lewinellaceae bacterium]
MEKILVADVLFGSPNKNCAGAGICKVIAPVAQETSPNGRWECNRAIALVKIDTSDTLVFQFVKHSMCRKAISKYFGTGIFLVEDPFEFRQNFWSEGSRTIRPGAYPIAPGEDYLTVSFKTQNMIWE